MLLLNLILLIEVTFSTPTGGLQQGSEVSAESGKLRAVVTVRFVLCSESIAGSSHRHAERGHLPLANPA